MMATAGLLVGLLALPGFAADVRTLPVPPGLPAATPVAAGNAVSLPPQLPSTAHPGIPSVREVPAVSAPMGRQRSLAPLAAALAPHLEAAARPQTGSDGLHAAGQNMGELLAG